MRKGVSEVEAEECRLLSISFHTISGLTISCAVPTWSWSQLLSASVQMEQACYLDLYSLERSFIQNGSWMWMRELGKLHLGLSLCTLLIYTPSVGMSENGWTDDFLCTQWFKESFIPQATAHNTSTAPILLIYDGHGSHKTDEMWKLAEENNIELFCLPPHMTHHTQPLDDGVFGPLQHRWMQRCGEVLEETGEEIRKVDFIREYMVAREQAFLPGTIQKAWQKCGICPLKPDFFSDADFAPSASTSTCCHLPSSYPFSNDGVGVEGTPENL